MAYRPFSPWGDGLDPPPLDDEDDPIPIPASTLPGIRGRCAQLYRVLGQTGVTLHDAKRMTFTEAAICLGRDISSEDRVMLQQAHADRRGQAKLPPGQRMARNATPEIRQSTVRDAEGKVRRFEKGVAADQ